MLYLILGVIAETTGAIFLGKAEGFTKPWPSLAALACVPVGMWCWSLSLKTLDVGASYAIWASLGIVLTGIAGWVFFKQQPDWPAFAGYALILAGVVVIGTLSNTVHE